MITFCLIVVAFLIYKVWDLSEEMRYLRDELESANLALHSFDGTAELKSGRLEKSTEDAACWDIFSNQDATIFAGESRVISTGIVTEMHNCDALIFSRSGLAAKKRITHRAGVIDSKYPDEWGVVLVNEGEKPYMINKGDRIAQVMFIPKFEINIIGDAVVSTDTRTGGFGSTDKPKEKTCGQINPAGSTAA